MTPNPQGKLQERACGLYGQSAENWAIYITVKVLAERTNEEESEDEMDSRRSVNWVRQLRSQGTEDQSST